MTRRLAVLAFLLACGDEPARVTRELSCQLDQRIPIAVNRNLDLLFVIDDSPGMADRQATLEANLPRFMDLVSAANGLDFHIGVISADPADDGRLTAAPRLEGCAPPDGPFIRYRERLRGGSESNLRGELRDAFTCIASLGAAGGGPRPNEAIGRALAHLEGEGFIREDAFLAVVIVSSADDPTPAEWQRAAKPIPELVLTSVVAPAEAVALRRLAGHESFAPLEGEDYTAVLRPFVQPATADPGHACLWGAVDLADVAPAEPGLQLGCALELGRYDEPSRAVGRCALDASGAPDLGELPCWWVRPDPTFCGEDAAVGLHVELEDWPAPGAFLSMHCPVHCSD